MSTKPGAVHCNIRANNTSTAYTYNNADQLTSSLTGGVTNAYTYDDDGNQTGDGAKTFVYDLENRLTRHVSGATTTTYTYDGQDKRLTRATNGTVNVKYSWDTVGGIPELALERDGTGGLVRRYVQGPIGPVSVATPAGVFYYASDPIGSVRSVTDSAGVEQWRYDYDPYGEPRATTQTQAGAPVNPVQFTGEYLDTESALYHLRARQYDPTTGRFDAMDPVDGPLTDPYTGEYVYVSDGPLRYTDPLGEMIARDGLSPTSSRTRTPVRTQPSVIRPVFHNPFTPVIGLRPTPTRPSGPAPDRRPLCVRQPNHQLCRISGRGAQPGKVVAGSGQVVGGGLNGAGGVAVGSGKTLRRLNPNGTKRTTIPARSGQRAGAAIRASRAVAPFARRAPIVGPIVDVGANLAGGDSVGRAVSGAGGSAALAAGGAVAGTACGPGAIVCSPVLAIAGGIAGSSAGKWIWDKVT